MRPTALKMAKNQGLVSIPQNKKNKKNKKFREKAAEGCVGIPGRPSPAIWPRFLHSRRASYTSVFVPYVQKTNEAPAGAAAGAAAGLLRGCCCTPYGGGGCCCGAAAATGTDEAKRAGGLRPANGERQRVTGNGCERPQIPYNIHK